MALFQQAADLLAQYPLGQVAVAAIAVLFPIAIVVEFRRG